MFHIEMYKLMKYIPGKQMEREAFYDQFEKRGKNVSVRWFRHREITYQPEKSIS